MKELGKAYEPKEVEERWLKACEGIFRAESASNKPKFSVVMPPPNVTGVLHIGHALNNTLQDVLVRYYRMNGFEALWIPGTDHAGIATQTVVERHLLATCGKRRSDFSRDAFIKICWEWKEKSETQILSQIRRLGLSCDWSRLRFTMDANYNRSVRVMFKKLFSEGLIYRGDYLVNWDPVTETALADDEVEYEERHSSLWYFSYPVENSNEHIQIATTRPETLLGDTGVAVHPKDPRYHHLIGNYVLLPLMGRRIPIIADEDVDPTFGTGAVKITPAHDFNDYAMAQRHQLPIISIMSKHGKINANGGIFEGMTMQAARVAVVQAMQEAGAFVKSEPYTTRVGVSYRSKAVIEPHLSKQWFIRVTQFKERLRSLVASSEIRLLPEVWKATYMHWIDNLRDWCISRQLWWGHRIPIWYNKRDPSRVLCSDTENPPDEVLQHPHEWEQDPDVLDTWFSSGLWPLATMGWPEQTQDLAAFFPISVLVSGYDILGFWIARMILMSTVAVNKIPFHTVFLNGIIYGKSYWRTNPQGGVTYILSDERKKYDADPSSIPADVEWKWEKMSKSKGNVLDPIEVINHFGCDTLRMTLVSHASTSAQIDLDQRKFEEYKNFANKLWNGARFVLMHCNDCSTDELARGIDVNSLQLEDKWILTRLNHAVNAVHTAVKTYHFDKAMEAIYNFFWNDFCAYYLEISKQVLFQKTSPSASPDRSQKQKLLLSIFLQIVRLLHPIAPFITEELFAIFKGRFPHEAADPFTNEACTAAQANYAAVAPFPVPFDSLVFDTATGTFDWVLQFVLGVRNLRAEIKCPTNTATDLFVYSDTPQAVEKVRPYLPILSALIKIGTIHFEQPQTAHTGCVIEGIHIAIPTHEQVRAVDIQQLVQEKQRLEEAIAHQARQLALPQFLAKAPPQLIEKHEKNLEKLRRDLQSIENSIAGLNR